MNLNCFKAYDIRGRVPRQHSPGVGPTVDGLQPNGNPRRCLSESTRHRPMARLDQHLARGPGCLLFCLLGFRLLRKHAGEMVDEL